jgi:hypothetical protein
LRSLATCDRSLFLTAFGSVFHGWFRYFDWGYWFGDHARLWLRQVGGIISECHG